MPDPLKNRDVRWRQRFQNFKQALAQLREAALLARERELSKLEQQGLIQAFEFTHELAWNTQKDFLELSGVSDLFGSRDVTREAFAANLIADGETWMDMIKNRNLTTHTYDKRTADKIAAAILERYVTEFDAFERRLNELEAKKR
jgi:nucleotidyltransferase substrate binding protein (TIGR01987 family)